MADPRSLHPFGDSFMLLMNDGTKHYAVPTVGMHVFRPNAIEVSPDAPTQNQGVVTIPSSNPQAVTYYRGGAALAAGSSFNFEGDVTVTAEPRRGYKFPNGFNPSWTFNYTPPPPPSGFKYPFPWNQHTTYPGHSGADWPGATVGNRAAVKAIGPGTVVQRYDLNYNTTDQGNPGAREPIWRGNCIVINHGVIDGNTIWSLYAHLSSMTVGQGASVNGGDVIGEVGNTGYSFGAHLHFEIIFNGVRLETNQGGYERCRDWMAAHADGSW